VRVRLAGLVAVIGWLVAAPAAPAATLSFSTYFGGTHHDQVNDVAVDSAGNVYVVGWTMSADLPVRSQLYGFVGGQGHHECEDFGCPDAFVAKLTPGGRSVIYATYLPGSRFDEATAIAVDGAGNAYVAGMTSSPDFPGGGSGTRAFVVKLTPDGSSLAWTRFVGSTYQLNEADVAVDDAGRLYLAGTTNDPFFPTTPGAYDRECYGEYFVGGCYEAYVARFTTDGAHLATTMLGNQDTHDTATSVAIDSAGRPVVAGGTSGYGFPDTPGTYGEPTDPKGESAFIARFSADLSTLEWASEYGGRDGDRIADLVLDTQDRPIVVGWTDSRDYPTTAGAVDRLCNNSDDWYACPQIPDGFATMFTAEGTDLVWSTFIGGSSDDLALGVALEADGGIAIAGATESARTFPLKDPYQSQVRYSEEGCPGPTRCMDAFLVRLGPGGELRYGTVLGGDSNDEGRGAAVDGEGRAWIAGAAFSDGVPVTADAVQPSRAGGQCEMPFHVHEVANCSDGLIAAFGPPGPLPATTTDGSSVPPPSTTSSATGTAGSPAAATRRLTVNRRGRRLTGRLNGDCAARARLVLERRTGAGWRVVRRLRTRANGRFTLRLPARVGRYRVRAPRTPGCAAVTTRVGR
jgi:hypothetical protein